jgi:hypothetical protein
MVKGETMSEEYIEVKMTSGLPKGHVNNGLPSIAGELVERPAGRHVAVVVIDTARITIDTDTDRATPTVRVLRVEPITRPDDLKVLRRLLTRAVEERIGQTTLPIEMEAAIREVFGDE